MLPWIIQISVISLILIVFTHYLFTFFKTNLTIPKVKDLVNKPKKQYEALFDTMKDTTIHHNPIETDYTNTNMNTNANTQNETINMKNELKNYLKELSESKKTSELTTGPTYTTSNSNSLPVPNMNDNGGLLTSENVMGNSFSSNSYSTF